MGYGAEPLRPQVNEYGIGVTSPFSGGDLTLDRVSRALDPQQSFWSWTHVFRPDGNLVSLFQNWDVAGEKTIAAFESYQQEQGMGPQMSRTLPPSATASHVRSWSYPSCRSSTTRSSVASPRPPAAMARAAARSPRCRRAHRQASASRRRQQVDADAGEPEWAIAAGHAAAGPSGVVVLTVVHVARPIMIRTRDTRAGSSQTAAPHHGPRDASDRLHHRARLRGASGFQERTVRKWIDAGVLPAYWFKGL